MVYKNICVNFIAFILLFFFSCQISEEAKDVYALKLDKTDSIVLENKELIFGKFVEKFRVSNNDSLLVFLDRMQSKVFVFDRNGNVLTTIGERGKGPKGLMSPHSFYINDENKVTVYDASQRMMKLFNTDGEVFATKKVFTEGYYGPIPNEFHSVNEKIITPVIETQYVLSPEKSVLFALINSDGKIDTLFGEIDSFAKEDKQYDHFTNITVDENNLVVYSNLSSSPFIQAHSLESFERLEYFGEETPSFKLPEKEIHPQLPLELVKERSIGLTSSMGLYLTENYIIQHMQSLTKEWFELTDYRLKDNYLVIYDRETKAFIQELPTEHTLGAVQDNKLYFIEDFNPDNYTIGIYEIVAEDN